MFGKVSKGWIVAFKWLHYLVNIDLISSLCSRLGLDSRVVLIMLHYYSTTKQWVLSFIKHSGWCFIKYYLMYTHILYPVSSYWPFQECNKHSLRAHSKPYQVNFLISLQRKIYNLTVLLSEALNLKLLVKYTSFIKAPSLLLSFL